MLINSHCVDKDINHKSIISIHTTQITEQTCLKTRIFSRCCSLKNSCKRIQLFPMKKSKIAVTFSVNILQILSHSSSSTDTSPQYMTSVDNSKEQLHKPKIIKDTPYLEITIQSIWIKNCRKKIHHAKTPFSLSDY